MNNELGKSRGMDVQCTVPEEVRHPRVKGNVLGFSFSFRSKFGMCVLKTRGCRTSSGTVHSPGFSHFN